MHIAEKTQTNSKSVVSLTLGILSILLPYIGFVLGVIGVIVARKAAKEIEGTNEGGGGLATSGLICSIVGIVIQTFAIVSIIAYLTLTSVG